MRGRLGDICGLFPLSKSDFKLENIEFTKFFPKELPVEEANSYIAGKGLFKRSQHRATLFMLGQQCCTMLNENSKQV